MVNDHYYNDGVEITREEAHALRDKSKLIVADRVVLKAESDAILKANKITEEPIMEEEIDEDSEEPEEEVL